MAQLASVGGDTLAAPCRRRSTPKAACVTTEQPWEA
jgi:hypothetical protein